MLSDRPYMRGDYQRERTSVLTWLLCAIAAGFIVQLLLGAPWLRNGAEMIHSLGLSVPALREGWVWTLLTYSFLHDPRFIFHILFNLFALYLLGRELLPMLGRNRFLGLYAAATIVGGLAWAALHWKSGASPMLLGATSAVEAMFIVYACFFPNQELNFLVLFLFPVTVKPKHIAIGWVIFELVALFRWEIPGLAVAFDIPLASSAHLGGMLTGFIFYRALFGEHWFSPRRNAAPVVEPPRWVKRAAKTPVQTVTTSTPAVPPTPPSTEDLRAEVDRILDKINSQGFGALTAEEKRILADARDQLSRR